MFVKHLEKLQEFWSVLEDIEKTLWVDHKMSSLAMSSRHINIGIHFVYNKCSLLPLIDNPDVF